MESQGKNFIQVPSIKPLSEMAAKSSGSPENYVGYQHKAVVYLHPATTLI